MLSIRRERAISAIAALAQNSRDAPAIAAELQNGARQMRQAVPITKRVGDVPLVNILEYIQGATLNLHDLFAEAIRWGYSLSRHPAFIIDFDEETERQLAHALSCLMQIHRSALRHVAAAMTAYARAAARLKWHARVSEVHAVHHLVIQMLKSPTLPVGQPFCHSAFDPPESP